jgi:squalene synthase HpnC
MTKDLDRYGPEAAPAAPPTLRQSRRYCRRFARRHYENFTVLSRLLPRRLRQHVANVYAYCRWADDLADECSPPECSPPECSPHTPCADSGTRRVPPTLSADSGTRRVPNTDPPRALALLAWWETQLRDCYRGRATHPVFIALRKTIEEFDVPADPFIDLLVAFRQDQQVARYETVEEVIEYCRWSANPVGRLVLYLGRCHTPERVRLADSICTGLQLANFCQDVARDWDRGRIYLPQAACRRFGYDQSAFARRDPSDAFRQLLAAQVDQAEGWLRAGLPLAGKMPAGLRLPVALFAAGGLAVLEAIRRQNYDVWTKRPTVSRLEKLQLAVRCWWKLRFVGRIS